MMKPNKSPDVAAMEDLMAEPADGSEVEVEVEAKPKGDPAQLLASIESKLAQLRELL